MPNAARIAKSASQLVHVGGDIAEEGITPGGQRAHGVQGYKEAPFSTFAMQVAGVAPTVAMFSLVPGGFIGEGLAGGTMLAGQVVDQAIAKSNNLSDAQKQDRIPYLQISPHRQRAERGRRARQLPPGAGSLQRPGDRQLDRRGDDGRGRAPAQEWRDHQHRAGSRGAVEAGAEAAVGGGAAAAAPADVERQKAESVEKSKTGEAGPIDWSHAMSAGLEGAFDNGAHRHRRRRGCTAVKAKSRRSLSRHGRGSPAHGSGDAASATDAGCADGPEHAAAFGLAARAGSAAAHGRAHSASARRDSRICSRRRPATQRTRRSKRPRRPLRRKPCPLVPQADLPLKPPAYAPTAAAPEGQGDLFAAEGHHSRQLEAPAPCSSSCRRWRAPPTKSLEEIQADIGERPRRSRQRAVDTSTKEPPAEARCAACS